MNKRRQELIDARETYALAIADAYATCRAEEKSAYDTYMVAYNATLKTP